MNDSPPLKVRIAPNPPLRDQAYSSLKDALLSGKFAPGDHLVEIEIAQSLGLSRSPIREAFRRLEQEGYLTVTRNGVLVQHISPKEIEGIYFVRQKLEAIAATLVAERANPQEIAQLRQAIKAMELALKEKNEKKLVRAGNDFHALLYSLTDNSYLIDLLNGTYDKIRHFRNVNLTVYQRGRAAIQEHQAIVEAIARHDAKQASRMSEAHIKKSWEHTRHLLAESSNEND